MLLRLARALPAWGLLLAACAVNPLTPTPQPTAPAELVLAAVGGAPSGADGPAATTPAQAATEPAATGAAATQPANVIGVVIVSTQVEIIEQATATPPPLPTQPPVSQLQAPPATQGPPPPTPIPPVWVAPPVSADVAAAEQYCIDLINAQRAAAGLPPYARDETVMGIARARVADMIARGYRGHYDPVTGASLARQMLNNAGFAFASENWYGHRAGPVAIVEAAMAWFMTDPPHAAGILNTNYSLVGVGIGYNGTQWLLIQNFAGS